MIPPRRPRLGARTMARHATVEGGPRGFAFENPTREGISERTGRALHCARGHCGGGGGRAPDERARAERAGHWGPREPLDSGESRPDRRRGGSVPHPGRRRAGAQRGACARGKLLPSARTGSRRALRPTGSARRAPAAPRKFPPSAPTGVSGRRGAGPRHSCRHTKERGGYGWPRGARLDVNKPRGPLGEPSAGCGSGGAAPAR